MKKETEVYYKMVNMERELISVVLLGLCLVLGMSHYVDGRDLKEDVKKPEWFLDSGPGVTVGVGGVGGGGINGGGVGSGLGGGYGGVGSGVGGGYGGGIGNGVVGGLGGYIGGGVYKGIGVGGLGGGVGAVGGVGGFIGGTLKHVEANNKP